MRRIIIVGAGLGGLTAAHGLISRGLDVDVYEQDSQPDARPQGYRIQLDEPGIAGLRECLPLPLFELAMATSGCPPPRVTVRNRRLDVLSESWREAAVERPHAFDRSTLRRILLTGLGAHVHYGARLQDCRVGADGVTARFADGRVAIGDILVGADGVNSAVRGALLPGARVDDAGLRLIYGKIPLDAATMSAVPTWIFENIFNVVTGGPGEPHIGAGAVQLGRRPTDPVVDDYLAFMVGVPTAHPAMTTDERLRGLSHRGLHELACGLIDETWDPAIRALLGLWRTDSLIQLRISTAAAVPPWPPGRFTLIGDAIHAMSPVLAMGANTAIRDAHELVLALSAAGAVDPVEALSGYRERMLGYAMPLVAASRQTGRERVGQA